jgi:hypothetical protein
LQKVQGYSEQGGHTVLTVGSTSTTIVQESYPGSTVTIFDAGTLTLSTIASDSIGTPKANPFTTGDDSYWFFYADPGNYDVRFSGLGIDEPFTFGDIHIGSDEAADSFIQATYITQLPHAELDNEQALSTLATGLVLSETSTGIVSTLANSSGSEGDVVTLVGGVPEWAPGGGGGGTVTSVGLAVPEAEFSVAGSPVTTSGTLTITKDNQGANLVWAGPTSGAAAQPTFRALVGADIPTNIRDATINLIIEGLGSPIPTGIAGDLQVDFNCTILSATLLADQSGDIVVDVWKDSYANFPPTVADTITAAAKPTISGSNKSQDVTLTGWTTSISAGDILRFNVDSVATIERCTLALKVRRT